tara:strand:- start:1342 stop:1623 length:282 start_codon:yes stop_codon:yes gene_type:complete
MSIKLLIIAFLMISFTVMVFLTGCGEKDTVITTAETTPTTTVKEVDVEIVENTNTTTESDSTMIKVNNNVTEGNTETVTTNDNTTDVEGENND